MAGFGFINDQSAEQDLEEKGLFWPLETTKAGKFRKASGQVHIKCCALHLSLFPRGGLPGVLFYGGNIWKLMWEVNKQTTFAQFERYVQETMDAYEDRIESVRVLISPEDGNPTNVSVGLYFREKYSEETGSTTVAKTDNGIEVGYNG